MRDDWHCDDAALAVLEKPLRPREVIKLEKTFYEDLARWRLDQQREHPPKRRFVEPTGAALEALIIKVLAVNARMAAKAKMKGDREQEVAEKKRLTRMLARRRRLFFEST